MMTFQCITYRGTTTLGTCATFALHQCPKLITYIVVYRLGPASTSKNSYFTANFGPLNHKFRIANHEFVALDAAGLVYEDYQRHAKHLDLDTWTQTENSTISFVKDAAQGIWIVSISSTPCSVNCYSFRSVRSCHSSQPHPSCAS